MTPAKRRNRNRFFAKAQNDNTALRSLLKGVILNEVKDLCLSCDPV